MEKVLFILRGLPGSGKSTVAELLAGNDYPICTADDFFVKKGEYKFNAALLGKAHNWCQSKAENAMKNGVARVFLANTSTTEKELAPYLKMAETYGYSVVSLVVENRHGNSNVHGVPADKLMAMKERFVIKL